MSLKKEKSIIEKAVQKAAKNNNYDRHAIARQAALLANKKGVNVQCAPYLQDIFYDALNKYA